MQFDAITFVYLAFLVEKRKIANGQLVSQRTRGVTRLKHLLRFVTKDKERGGFTQQEAGEDFHTFTL